MRAVPLFTTQMQSMSTHHWNPANPQRRERLIDLAKSRRVSAPPEVSPAQAEAQAPQCNEEILGDESANGLPTE